MMPMAMGRKALTMEKVENLCRAARVQNDSINTSKQFRSRLRDACGTIHAAPGRRSRDVDEVVVEHVRRGELAGLTFC
jgi:hypothetical protein